MLSVLRRAAREGKKEYKAASDSEGGTDFEEDAANSEFEVCSGTAEGGVLVLFWNVNASAFAVDVDVDVDVVRCAPAGTAFVFFCFLF